MNAYAATAVFTCDCGAETQGGRVEELAAKYGVSTAYIYQLGA